MNNDLFALKSVKEVLAGQVVTRFAPSPTGYLHLGHAFSALFCHAVARALDATLLLRIEDHDRQRSKPPFVEQIISDLRWLGIVDHTISILDQGSRFDRYEALVQSLLAQGHAYRCTCTRKQLTQISKRTQGSSQFYPGICRDKARDPTLPHCIRFALPGTSVEFRDLLQGEQVQRPADDCGDFILVDRMGNPSYQLANVVDDHDQGVNLILRGTDLLDSTGRQALLRECLFPAASPPLYGHHPLLYETIHGEKQKLSKRHFSTSIAEMRGSGWAQDQVIGACMANCSEVQKDERLSLVEAETRILEEFCR